MVRCFSFIAALNWWFRCSFRWAGLREDKTDLGDGTAMHCWAPKNRDRSRPDLVLIHGVGSNAMWQWNEFLPLLVPWYNIYVPDLVFFGDSYTTQPERSDEFQARCVAELMDALGVSRFVVSTAPLYLIPHLFPMMKPRMHITCLPSILVIFCFQCYKFQFVVRAEQKE